MRLDEWLTSAARARPDHVAVEVEGRALTYAELHERSDELARALAVAPGERVRAPARAELGFCTLLHALPRRGAALEPLPAVAHAPPLPLGGAGEALRDELDPGAVHTVMHTSGTTGEPKAVELSFANHLASAEASGAALGTEPADRWLCPLPLHHVAGLNILIRCAIHRTTAVLHHGFELDRVRAVLEAGEVTLASMVPTMLERLRAAGLRAAPGLRTIALGGGPIPPGLLEWAAQAGIPVTPVYGMTETCSQVVAGVPGRPMRGVELRLGPEREILLRGPMIAAGALAPDGWLHTGDRGRLDANGLLEIDGRIKELIVSGGENVAPLEVENALLAHPAVAEAGVAGVPDPDWGEAVTAFVVLSAPASEEDLRDWCRARLAPHAVPKAVHTLPALPRNASGKLLRDRLTSRSGAAGAGDGDGR